MTRAYIRLDPEYPDRKADYPDGAFTALTMTICYGAQQPKPGRFRSRKLLAVLLERRARWIGYLLDHGDLIELPDGTLYIDGWDEWQEGDWRVVERMSRIRNRKRNQDRNDDRHPPSDVSVSVSNSESVSGAPNARPARLVKQADGTFVVVEAA
jgi:hypothetical protein